MNITPYQEGDQVTESDIVYGLRYADYFIKRFCKIETTGAGLVPFTLFPYQLRALQEYEKHDALFVLKGRQLGFTTLAAAYALWTAYKPGQNVLFLSKKEDDAMDILRKVKIMHDNLPKEMQLEVVSSNASTLEFTNKNRIQSLPATDRAGAGKTAYLVIMDEFSGYPGAKATLPGEDVWRSIYPTLSTGGRIIVQSTPRGVGNKFARIWADDNGFRKMKFLWYDHPKFGKDLYKKNPPDDYGKYGSPWADTIQKNLTPDDWAQEYNGDFLQSGRPVFQRKYLVKNQIEEKDVQYDCTYVCGVDLASGTSKDWSVAQFINAETGKQVAVLRTQDPLDVFGEKVVALCEKLNNALLIFENNSGWGLSFMKHIQHYGNLYYQTRFDKRAEKKTAKLGWNTNMRSKELMITDLNLAFVQAAVQLTDQKTIDECTTYQYDDNDRMNAMAGCNDDCVTSLAIAWQGVLHLRKKFGIDARSEEEKVEEATFKPVLNELGLLEQKNNQAAQSTFKIRI